MEVKWIKITTDMFDHRKIRYLRRMEQGNEMVLIWVMLLTLAGQCNDEGRIRFTEDIPYTPKLLAEELDFDETLTEHTLATLKTLGMIDNDGDSITVVGWNEYQNAEGLERIRKQNRERKQCQREREKAQREEHHGMSRDGHTMSRDGHATEKEREEEKEKEKPKKNKNVRQASLPSEKSSSASSLLQKHTYGIYENVFLTEEAYEELRRDFPRDFRERIDNLSSFLQVTGKEYCDHEAAIRHYAATEAKREAERAARSTKGKKNAKCSSMGKPPQKGAEPRYFRGEQEEDDIDLIVL